MSADLDDVIIETALRKMIKGGYLSISTINEIVKMKGIIPDAQIQQRLSLLHCVNFSDMPPAVRDALPGMIRQVLAGIEFDVEAIFRPEPSRESGRVIELNPPPAAAAPRRGLLRYFKGEQK